MRTLTKSPRLLTAGGAETYLLFVQRAELREFCGFDVYRHEEQLARLEDGFLAPTLEAALATGHDLLVDALTWRAHGDFVAALDYPKTGVEDINGLAVRRMREIVARFRGRTPGSDAVSVFVNGDIGPRGDGYRFDGGVTLASALAYHRRQVQALAKAGADAISALTMTNVAETVALALAAREVDVPCIVSPTVETDGRTPEGLTLGEFITAVERGTDASPLFYMVNCAHPEHLEPALVRAHEQGAPWLPRLRGFRANASRKSHAELDCSTELDRGDPHELAAQMARMQRTFGFTLIGGCCGTDAEHVACMAHAVDRVP